MASRQLCFDHERLDGLSDSDSCSDASFDSIREAAYNAGEDPDFDLDSSDEEWSTRSVSPRSTPSKRSRRSKSVHSTEASVNGGTEKWNDCSVEDEAPALPPFLPKRNPGVQLFMDRTYSPLELFQLFFTTSVVDTIVKNTNRYAKIRSESGKRFLWLPLKAQELYSYIGLVIYMGLLNVKNITDYWCGKEIYRLSFPKSVMSRSRFQAISWNLHLCHPEDDQENAQKKGTPAYDRLFKIKPLYNDIIMACQTYFHPGRQLAVDERMVASKARIGIKQYMKDKPVKWGYKLFVLADSVCGYTWNFFVYEGKSFLATGKGLSYDSVIQLLDLSLLGRGFHLYVDNFYTSPCLFMDLLAKKIVACGTVRSNCRGLPRTKKNDLGHRAQRGTIRWLREGKLLFVKWMDTRAVTMCSTMHKAYDGDQVFRRVKNPEGVWERCQIPIPAAVKDYNKYMGGVDLSDALIRYYNVLHKTRKWYKTFFYHFVDIAVVNSSILHQHLVKSQSKRPLTQKEFRERLVCELTAQSSTSTRSTERHTPCSTEPHTPRSTEPHTPRSTEPHTPRSTEPHTPRSTEPHTPSSTEPHTSARATGGSCYPEYFGSDATSGRRVCALCKLSGLKVKTPVYCTKCNVALCLVASRNCFRKWHTDGHANNI